MKASYVHGLRIALAVATLSVFWSGCAVEASPEETDEVSSNIIGGVTDSGHPSVAFVQWEIATKGTKSGYATCSGTLVAPRVILTAAHCVVSADPARTFSGYVAYFGTTPRQAKPAEVYKGVAMTAHPRYSPAVFGAYDVAIIELDRDVQGVPLVPVARSLPNLTGKSVTHVGWGVDVSKSATEKSGGGTKRKVVLPVTAELTQTFRTGNGKSSVCNGDSGGPALLLVGGREIVAGVHSYVDDTAKCLGNGYSFRPDTAIDFIAKYAPGAFADPPPGAAPTPRATKSGRATGADVCCINGSCWTCPNKAALDCCIGVDLGACFGACGGTDAQCFSRCGRQAGTARHDPSACVPD